MRSLRERLKSYAETLFPWLWRLTLLALPWQTRLFQEGPMIAGYPWEEGRISLYASEILMLLTVVTALFLSSQTEKKLNEVAYGDARKWLGPGLTLLFVGITFFTTSSLRSTFEWWVEVGMLVVFFSVLVKRVSLRDISIWVSLSLIPHAILGIWQAISQYVIGSSLFGMAAQDPRTFGVSVIEVGQARWLRSYGGFSHPNLFGGWLVLGIALVCRDLKEAFTTRRTNVFNYFLLFLFSCALALTYSRSAWFALGLFCMASLAALIRQKAQIERRTQLIAFGVILVSGIGTVLLRPGLLFSRAQIVSRLEQKSLSERSEGVQNALRILGAHPLFGSGLGANGLVLSRLNAEERVPTVIPVPPHTVPLLALAELGILGSILLLIIVGLHVDLKQISLNIVPFLPIVFLDHYLWSYWGGKVLFVSLLALIFLKRSYVDKVRGQQVY